MTANRVGGWRATHSHGRGKKSKVACCGTQQGRLECRAACPPTTSPVPSTPPHNPQFDLATYGYSTYEYLDVNHPTCVSAARYVAAVDAGAASVASDAGPRVMPAISLADLVQA